MPLLIDTLSSPSDARDLGDEMRRLFDEFEASAARHSHPLGGECRPALDVVENDGEFEVVMDVPGVRPDDVRVLLKQGTLLIAGRKQPPDPGERADASFHLVERGFGRFARAVRLNGAIDGGRAHASLTAGVLRIVVPKLRERRGEQFIIPVKSQNM